MHIKSDACENLQDFEYSILTFVYFNNIRPMRETILIAN
jgi:hypothetical protein